MDYEIEHIMTAKNKVQNYDIIYRIRCTKGIVIAADTQGIEGCAKVKVRKIYKINDSIVIGTAGTQDHIEEFVEDLKDNLKQEIFESEKSLKDRIHDILSEIHALLHDSYSL